MQFNNKVSVDDRDAASGSEQGEDTPRADNLRDDVSEATPEPEAPKASKWGKVKELMPSADIDDQGREKIRVNVGGIRKTVQTQGMNDDQFERFRKNTAQDTDEIDITTLSQLMTQNESKTDTVQEQKESMGEMRKQITMLVSVMSVQTALIFLLMVAVAWMMKDQFVENGLLTDGNGNVIKVSSSDFEINGGKLQLPGSSSRRKLGDEEAPNLALTNAVATFAVQATSS